MRVAKIIRSVGWWCAALWMCASPAHADPVTERGLRHTKAGRALVETAVLRASRMVAATGLRLRPSWSGQDAGVVPVYVVEGKPGALDSPAFVPKRCRCVFVAPATLEGFVSRNSAGAGRMQLDAGHVLTFMLLHEAGHLLQDTAGGVVQDGELLQLNTDDALAKNAESNADEFAADLLQRLTRPARPDALSIDANWVTIELTKLSWNMQAFRTLDEFASFSVGKPAVYWDDGYTHPNLALRILRINDRIHSSEATRALLAAFEEARSRSAHPQPLYQRR